MKKRVQIQNIKPSQILNLRQTKHLKGGDDTDVAEAEADIIIEDVGEL